MKPNLISAARGKTEADLLITNARIVNVFSGEVVSGSIVVAEGYIVGFGSYPAKRKVDLKGRYVCPGFIDAHVHIESSMTGVSEFVRAVVPSGTTSVIADPHEIANVWGTDGIRYMLQSAEHQPLDIRLMLPSCVPATEDLETSGARLSADDLLPFLKEPRVVGLAELMNFPGVLCQHPDVLNKIEFAQKFGKPIDGHAPGLSGPDLYAYIGAGVSSDHECTTVQEATEKLEAGMMVIIREGTGAKNLEALLPLVNERTSRRMMWCTDDRHPHDLLKHGHIDSIVRDAVRFGLDPILAIQMATLNPSEHYGLHHVGAIAPGRQADLIVFSDLKTLEIEEVYCQGILTAKQGGMLPEIEKPVCTLPRSSMNVRIDAIDFSIPAPAGSVRVIEIVPNQIITRKLLTKMPVSNGMAMTDPFHDILKIAVIERHQGTGNMGKGFVKGFGLKQGALASSVAHDSHNIIVVGVNDEDMKTATEAVIHIGGGLAAACNGSVLAQLPLPIAGLMSPEPAGWVCHQLDALLRVCRELGTNLKDPFMTLSFLALPVIPELKITDKGLVENFQIVPMAVG